MSKALFNKFINSLSEDELRSELKLLYSKVNKVKEHYAMELGDDKEREKIYSKAKKDLRNLFYIRGLRRKRPKVQKIKSLLKNLESNAIFSHESVDIYLYSTEIALEYLLTRPNTTKATFNNCKENFHKALRLINEFGLQSDFQARVQLCVKDANLIYMLEEEFNELFNQYYK